MHLRSGALYRSRNHSISNVRSKASTKESTTRSQGNVTTPITQDVEYDSLSNSSMTSNSSERGKVPSTKLDYNVKIVYHSENPHNLKIYTDPINALYKRMDSGTAFYYAMEYLCSAGDVKILYVFRENGPISKSMPIYFLDKFNQEWI